MLPTFFKTSEAIGTHEFTGFVIIPTNAFGQLREIAAAMSRTTPAFVLKRSSRVIPGFRGTPAGMITTWAPVKFERCDSFNLQFGPRC